MSYFVTQTDRNIGNAQRLFMYSVTKKEILSKVEQALINSFLSMLVMFQQMKFQSLGNVNYKYNLSCQKYMYQKIQTSMKIKRMWYLVL